MTGYQCQLGHEKYFRMMKVFNVLIGVVAHILSTTSNSVEQNTICICTICCSLNGVCVFNYLVSRRRHCLGRLWTLRKWSLWWYHSLRFTDGLCFPTSLCFLLCPFVRKLLLHSGARYPRYSHSHAFFRKNDCLRSKHEPE